MLRPYASHGMLKADDDDDVDDDDVDDDDDDILIGFCLISCFWCSFSAQVDLCLHFYRYSNCYHR